jgi:hypothetical protein
VSVRRRPRRFEQEVWEGVRAQRVGGAHSLFSAAPINELRTAIADALSSVGGVVERVSKIDPFTCAGGAEDFTLSFLPIDESWNVSIGVAELTNGVGYTINGQTLSLETAADARAGETVQIQYDYLAGLPAAAAEPFAGIIESLGPLAWYRLDDVSNGGTMTDSSGHAHHGLWNAVTTHALTTSLVNDDDGALSMTGAGGEGAHVTSAAWMNLTGNVTWVVFFKTTDTAARLWARESTAGGVQDWSLQQGSQLYFAAGGSIVLTSVRTGLNDNNKHMAVFTHTGSSVALHIDGVFDNSAATSALATTAQDVYIGYGGGLTSSHMFTGTLDEAIWFDRVLTDTEIAAIWDAAT